MNVAIIGGGAAGFFAAISVKEANPEAEVIIFEKTNKLLSKVKVSGGGRCNVTNQCASISELVKAYPRGGKQLKKAFGIFNTRHTQNWFEERGVPLVTEPDGRIFPKSNRSQTIIDCLVYDARHRGVKIEMGTGILSITCAENGIHLVTSKDSNAPLHFDKVIVATGGSPKKEGLDWLRALGHKIVLPVPSLFTFNMPQEPVTQLMGVVASDVQVSVQGTKLKSDGPLLITHWGMSGPAILKLSAFGARLLYDMDYQFNIQVNWSGETNDELVKANLNAIMSTHSKKLISNYRPFGLPEKLWLFLMERAQVKSGARWSELGKKSLNRLVNILTNDVYTVSGKTTFKEEFVTCGGVSLESIDMKTMQSKVCPHLYFAGEVMDIDAITGGYNFQAAWTTGFIAGQLG